MIKLIQYRVGISPKLLIQNIVNLTGMQNGSIVIKVQNGKFVHLMLQPNFKPDELCDAEIIQNEKSENKT